jgi:uncharacterized RDD family membrane protein YckC
VTGRPAPASLGRRLFSLLYETLLVAALLMAGALPFVIVTQPGEQIAWRPLFQLYLLALLGLYLGWQWLHGGQTLPMRTWRLKLVTRDGGPITCAHVLKRLLFAFAGTLAFGAGYVWALIDADRQFLHDRLAGTRIVNC